MDLILGSFAQAYISDFSEDDLAVYDEILHCQDPDVYEWIMGRSDPPEALNGPVMTRLRAHRFKKNKE